MCRLIYGSGINFDDVFYQTKDLNHSTMEADSSIQETIRVADAHKNRKSEEVSPLSSPRVSREESSPRTLSPPIPLLPRAITPLDQAITNISAQHSPAQAPPKQEEPIEQTFADLFKLNFILKNSGATARDHLANERTFLSWIQTSIGFATFSVAFLSFYRLEQQVLLDVDTQDLKHFPIAYWKDISKFNTLSHYTKPLSILCVSISVISLFMGLLRYFHIQYHMIQGNFPAARLAMIVIVTVTMAMLICLIVMDFMISL